MTLLSAAMKSVIEVLEALKADRVDGEKLLTFTDLRERLGFNDYYACASKYLA